MLRRPMPHFYYLKMAEGGSKPGCPVWSDFWLSWLAGCRVQKGYEEVTTLMFEKGADLYAGQPNAVDAAKMFRREEMLGVFGIEQ